MVMYPICGAYGKTRHWRITGCVLIAHILAMYNVPQRGTPPDNIAHHGCSAIKCKNEQINRLMF